MVLLVASYYFYMSWNVSYVVLILFTTIVSYYSAIEIEKTVKKKRKKVFLVLSIGSSLAVLFFFKYFNFLGESINEVFSFVGVGLRITYLKLLLPVGISFYTFQTLSYTIDVYYGKKETERHFGIYALYVSFFPQLVAGPIERSTRLLPQFRIRHKLSWEKIYIGLKWMVLGFFMKLVIADRIGMYVDAVYNNVYQHSGITYIVATIMFAFQIYCDFAGYSSIAIGTAKLMGIDLMVNFRRPYFALSIGEFWKRWHISLSTWFRDYFYIPIGGSRVGKLRWLNNLFLTFLISGLWHGANWTFVIWGALHGIYLIIENLLHLNTGKNYNPGIHIRLLRMSIVFVLVNLAWIFFRANTVGDAFHILSHIADQGKLFIDYSTFFYGIIGLFILLLLDFIEEYNADFGLLNNKISHKITIVYSFLIIITLCIGSFNGGQFIYFQF